MDDRRRTKDDGVMIKAHIAFEKPCKTHTYSISVKQSLVSIILYNGFANNATDINDFLCKILGYW
jgi:hypothetical protein